MKKIYKNILILVVTLVLGTIVLNCFFNNVFAFTIDDLKGNQLSNIQLENAGNSIITIVTTIGSIVSVITLIIIGFKYMLGSVEERAEYKKTLMPYIIGAVLVFAASAISGMIYSFAINIGK